VAETIAWNIKAYAMFAWMWIKVSMTYRTSFVLLTIGQFLITGLDFAAILVIFSNVDSLGGFSLAEISFLYGGSALCLGCADLLLGNIERLGTRIRMGTFDAMLVRPVSPYVQMCADQFALRRLGRIAQAGIVLGWAVVALEVDWSPARIIMVPYLVVFGTAIFVALFTMGAAVQFWTADSAQVANAFTYGGSTLAQYPMTIYPDEAVRALTFIVPITFVNWYPSLFILDLPDPLGLPAGMQFAAPAAALILALVAAACWRTGLRHYRSTGS
jgi:ABC-2 type transport system permease protein